MGQYGLTTVLTTVVRVDKYPLPILMRTEEFVDFTNGRALAFPDGIMVVVGHYNSEGWGPDYYTRTIHVVPTTLWHPELNPADGPDAIIGYHENPSKFGRVADTYVKRSPFVPGDAAIEYALRSEGRWPWK